LIGYFQNFSKEILNHNFFSWFDDFLHLHIGVVHKWCHTLTGGGGHQICDKGRGGVSSFVMSHESFWCACYTQSYQKGRVWKCFYSICNSFLLQAMRKFLSILLMG